MLATVGQCMSRCVYAQDRDAGEGDAQWELSRFTPLMQEVLEDLAANKLNFDEYPYVQPPTSETGKAHAATRYM